MIDRGAGMWHTGRVSLSYPGVSNLRDNTYSTESMEAGTNKAEELANLLDWQSRLMEER